MTFEQDPQIAPPPVLDLAHSRLDTVVITVASASNPNQVIMERDATGTFVVSQTISYL